MHEQNSCKRETRKVKKERKKEKKKERGKKRKRPTSFSLPFPVLHVREKAGTCRPLIKFEKGI